MAKVIADYVYCTDADGSLWLDVRIRGKSYLKAGPFDTEAERRRAFDDLCDIATSIGAEEVPLRLH